MLCVFSGVGDADNSGVNMEKAVANSAN